MPALVLLLTGYGAVGRVLGNVRPVVRRTEWSRPRGELRGASTTHTGWQPEEHKLSSARQPRRRAASRAMRPRADAGLPSGDVFLGMSLNTASLSL